MPKYINPNNSLVTLDLGNPSRRNLALAPFAGPRSSDPSVVRVVEMSAKKADFFKTIGMIVELSPQAPEYKLPADVDVTALEEQASRILSGRAARGNQSAMEDAQAEQEQIRQVNEKARKEQEAKELAEAAELKKASDAAHARQDARTEASKGVVTTPGGTGPTTPVLPPYDPVKPIIPPAHDQVAPPAAVKVPLPAGSKMPASVGVEGDSSVDEQGEPKKIISSETADE